MRLACIIIAVVLLILAALDVVIGHFNPGWLGCAFGFLSFAMPN